MSTHLQIIDQPGAPSIVAVLTTRRVLWAALLLHPASLRASWKRRTGTGWVRFETEAAAKAALADLGVFSVSAKVEVARALLSPN